MVRQVINPVMLEAFYDELDKIAMAAPNPLKALKAGKFSTNVGSRSSIKMRMPTVSTKTPPVGRVTTVSGSSIPTNLAGANIKTPSTSSLAQQSQQLTGHSVPPASPVHVAPQTTPHASPTQQGSPQTVNTATAATGSGQSTTKSGIGSK